MPSEPHNEVRVTCPKCSKDGVPQPAESLKMYRCPECGTEWDRIRETQYWPSLQGMTPDDVRDWQRFWAKFGPEKKTSGSSF